MTLIKLLILIPVVSVFSVQLDLSAPNTPQLDLPALNTLQLDLPEPNTPQLDLTDLNTPQLDLTDLNTPQLPPLEPNTPQLPPLEPNTPQLPLLLERVVIYSGKAITMGANTIIYGNANTHSIEATTIGAGSEVSGDIVAGAAVTLGAGSEVSGGYIVAGAAVTLGAGSEVSGDIVAGAAVTPGAGSEVSGDIVAGAAVMPGASAKAELTQLQETLSEQVVPLPEKLTATMPEDRTLLAGVYHATALTTTAGITITFDGENKDGHWLINADDYIAFGAGIKMNLKNVTANSTITWNSKGYISIGAGTTLENSEVLGTFYASNYISTGAEVKVKGMGNSCGGLYTTNGYVILGAENTIGSIGCEVSSHHPTDPDYFSDSQPSQ